jgi:hypothetical protein
MLYNFLPRFADAVRRGQKRQTIRANGKRRHAAKGEKLQLYTGLRTRKAKKIRDAMCVASVDCTIRKDGISLHLNGKDLDLFARQDGFDSFAQLREFFVDTYGLPFHGRLIMWK